MGNQDKYKYDFKQKDAVRWLMEALKYNSSIQDAIGKEISAKDDREKYEAAFGFFCRAYFLVFSEKSQELGL